MQNPEKAQDYYCRDNDCSFAVVCILVQDATQDVNLSVEAQDVVEAKATAANQDASFGKISKYNYMKGNNFFVRVLDADKKPIVNKTVKYTFNGKTINSLTNENGYAGLSLNVSKGTYTVKCFHG